MFTKFLQSKKIKSSEVFLNELQSLNEKLPLRPNKETMCP